MRTPSCSKRIINQGGGIHILHNGEKHHQYWVHIVTGNCQNTQLKRLLWLTCSVRHYLQLFRSCVVCCIVYCGVSYTTWLYVQHGGSLMGSLPLLLEESVFLILLVFCGVFYVVVCLLCLMILISLDCLLLTATSVFSNVCYELYLFVDIGALSVFPNLHHHKISIKNSLLQMK